MHNKMIAPLLALVFACWTGSLLASTPEIQSWTTANGAKVLFVAAPDLPILDVRVVFDAGSARDGEHAGLAAFTNGMLTEGAGEWDADALARRVEDRGIVLASGSRRDMAWLSVRTLSEIPTRDVAVDTLGTVLASPRFDDTAIERVRQQMIVARRQGLQSPATVASERFYKALYGAHPYAHPPGGTEDSLAQISPAQLRRFHNSYYVGANAVIAMVGDIDRSEAEAIADRLTAGLKKGQHAPPLPEPAAVQGGELREAFPSSQTTLMIGQLGMARGDPDYFPLYVGNHALGGGSLVSLLGDEVRNKRGLSYSVYSYFSAMRAPGPFVMVAQTKNDKADDSLRVMRDTLKRFIEVGPSELMLESSKKNLIGGFPLKIASNSDIVEYISMIGFYGLPLDWLETLTDKIAAVDLEQVRSAFRRRVDPAKSIVVTVGGTP